MKNNAPNNHNSQNPSARESVITMADIAAAAQEHEADTTDPLELFPDLKAVAHEHCVALGLELVFNGVSPPLAERAACRAYRLTTLAALAMHRAIWNAVLPSDGPSSQS